MCPGGYQANVAIRCVAGWVGFDRDMGATRTLAADSAGDAMEATAAGMEEIELRTKDPLRMYRIWRQVGAGLLTHADTRALACLVQKRPAHHHQHTCRSTDRSHQCQSQNSLKVPAHVCGYSF